MKPKQLKDLKETRKIFAKATTDLAASLNLINNFCYNKISPAFGDYLIGFQRAMSNTPKHKDKSLDIPAFVLTGLAPIHNDLSELKPKLDRLVHDITDLIDSETKEKP